MLKGFFFVGESRRDVMDDATEMVDRNALRFNQAAIVTLTVVGFVTENPIFPAIVALVMLGGTVHRRLALFKGLYAHILKPLGLIHPSPVHEAKAPHEFAQLLGGVMLTVGTVFLVAGDPIAGWGLAWVVILLAAINLVFGFCAGCFVYYQLGKRGVPGFRPHVVTGGEQ
jgi:hypothetical protein